MEGKVVTLNQASQQILEDLANQTGKPSQTILEEALEAYRRQVFLEAVNAGYAALRTDPKAWEEEQAERNEWNATMMDGLDPEEHWSEDGHFLNPD